MSVGGVIGGAIGFWIGGPTGAQIGYSLGAAVEASTKTVDAPAPGDLSTQTAAYGSGVPEIFGRMRVTGQVLWSAPLVVRQEAAEGGKGGPTVEVNKYFWRAVLSFAWADPRIAPRGYTLHRLWINRRLVCDLTADLSAASDVSRAYEAAIASATIFRYAEWHGGGADQAAPIVQQEEDGAEATPGYRFHARLDIRDLPLTDDVGFGDLYSRPPVIEAEISVNLASSAAPTITTRKLFGGSMAYTPALRLDDGVEPLWWQAQGGELITMRGARAVARTEHDGALLF